MSRQRHVEREEEQEELQHPYGGGEHQLQQQKEPHDHRRWSIEEERALRSAIAIYGPKYAKILADPLFNSKFHRRDNLQLRSKHRQMERKAKEMRERCIASRARAAKWIEAERELGASDMIVHRAAPRPALAAAAAASASVSEADCSSSSSSSSSV